MSHEHSSVTVWLQRLKHEDSAAAAELWERFVRQLVRVASRRLGGLPRRVADEEDIALSAFAAFLEGVQQDRFPQLDDRDDLWQVLVMLVERKAVGLTRRERAAKRGQGLVRGDSLLEQAGPGAQPSPQPTPELAAQLAEELEGLLKSLGDSRLQHIAVAKLQGYTHQEIAEQLQTSLRSVERKCSIIRRRWTAQDRAPPTDD